MARLTDLHSGRMQAGYREGGLRYVTTDGAEVLRHLYMAVRDQHWNTIPAVFLREHVRQHRDGFVIEVEAEHCQSDIHFQWQGTIRASGNRIEASFDGTARSSFLRNRIGWCVLHPTRETAGKSCTVRHPNGSVDALQFPERISPHQPFFDVQSMSWSPAPGLDATLEFEGEVFETEDQRNWTDDSFKTYSTPLSIPIPVQINEGDRVSQRVVLTVEHRPLVSFTGKRLPFPQIRFIGSTHDRIVRVQSRRDLEPLRGESAPRWLIYDVGKPATTPETISAAREVLGSEAVIGGGAETNFTELNRNPAVADVADFVAFACNPQVHASDELSIIENLPAIGAAVGSARHIANGKPIAIVPLTLKRLFNPHTPEMAEAPDERQQQPFADAWLAGAIKYAAEAGAGSITVSPDTARATLEHILSFQPDTVEITECTHPREAAALAMWHGDKRRVLVANLTEDRLQISVEHNTLVLNSWEVAVV